MVVDAKYSTMLIPAQKYFFLEILGFYWPIFQIKIKLINQIFLLVSCIFKSYCLGSVAAFRKGGTRSVMFDEQPLAKPVSLLIYYVT